MKNTLKVFGIITIVAAFTLSAATCFNQSGGKIINSAEELKAYLDSQPANSPDKPIKVTMKVNDQMLLEIAGAIRDAGKYVSLNLSGNDLTTIPNNAFNYLYKEEGEKYDEDEEYIYSEDVYYYYEDYIYNEDIEDVYIDEVKDYKLVSITIPKSVTSIGGYAFSYCTSLTSVKIPNSVTSIGNNAFLRCTSLTNINIPNSVNNIGSGAFSNCRSLTGIIIPKSVTSIEESTFSYCSSLTSVIIPNSVTSIGNNAFSNCTKLIGVTIPDNVISIGDSAFYHCTSLTSITIPDSVTSIGGNSLMGVFEGCTSLTSVNIGKSVISIGMNAFIDCKSLTSITIPNSVKSIARQAFHSCTNLTSVTFQGTIDKFDSYAFSFADKNSKLYSNELRAKYLAGGTGTYTTTAPVNENSKYTKQPVSSNQSVSGVKSSGKVSAFPGRWHLIEGRGDAKEVELFKDGTGTADGYGITWKVENGRFHILHPFYTLSAYYNVTDSTITLTQDDGEIIKYQKR